MQHYFIAVVLGSLTSVEENIEQNFNDLSNHGSSNNTRSFTSSCYSSVSSVASDSNYQVRKVL